MGDIMEKWKAVVIMLLIGGLLGYGAFQSKQVTKVEETLPVQTNASNPTGNFTPNQQIQQFVGKPLPAWNIPSKYWINTSKALSPSDFKGSVTILEFYRINCSHCQEAAPLMKEMGVKYGPKGLKMVGIQSPSLGDKAENRWSTVAQVSKNNFGFSHPVAFDENSVLFRTAYKGRLYPSVFLTDKKGIVVFAQTGFDADKEALLRAAVERELAKK
jgi:thiol-disulfide isomerase/thioredoxin